jgi:four helix bundle protein
MAQNKIQTLSMELAVEIIKLSQELQKKREYIISNQIGRSGTSIGANVKEAQYAQSKADFISKLKIALKEANETGYWLDLLRNTEYISEALHKQLSNICTSIRVALIHSVRTMSN